MKTLVVVPTYNEIENLQLLVESILSMTPPHLEILVVDDGSPDGTGELADSLVRDQTRCHVLHRKKKLGLGTAYVEGFNWGMDQGFEALIEMDADFSHHPRYLISMLQNLEQNDVVIGSRYVSGGGTLNWGLGRKLLSRGGSLYARTILKAPISDFTGGFNGWKRQVLQGIDLGTLRSDGYSFQIELKYRAYQQGYQIVEFPIIFEDRKVGKSKMSRRIILEALVRVWSFRSNSTQKKL